MDLTPEQRAFVARIREMWEKGATQRRIADELEMNLSTMRGRLRYYGYRFGRAGKLLPVHTAESGESLRA